MSELVPVEIDLHCRAVPELRALIDAEDAELAARFRWWRLVQEHTTYVRTEIEGRLVYLHAFLTGWVYVDHVDGDGLNNRRSNLRPTNAELNAANRRKPRGTSSQYKGVSLYRNGRWLVQIRTGGRREHLGYFGTEVEAAHAYDAAAFAAWGEHANLNFPYAVMNA